MTYSKESSDFYSIVKLLGNKVHVNLYLTSVEDGGGRNHEQNKRSPYAYYGLFPTEFGPVPSTGK